MHHASLNLDVTFRPSSSANVRGEGSARRETLHGVGPPRWRASTARNPAVTSASAVRNATESLARVKADETIMFDPVPGRQDALNVVYAYPNEYSVGITSLGYQLVWAYLETCELTNVVRRFTDLADPLNKRQRVDLLGFSFSWELDYSNIISMLEDMDIAIDAKDRGEGDPIIFGGGPVLTANPEPYAAWFDCVLVGDGEQLLDDFIRAVHEVVTGGGSRREILCKLCTISGVYIPQFYEPVYQGVEIVDIKSLHGHRPTWRNRPTAGTRWLPRRWYHPGWRGRTFSGPRGAARARRCVGFVWQATSRCRFVRRRWRDPSSPPSSEDWRSQIASDYSEHPLHNIPSFPHS